MTRTATTPAHFHHSAPSDDLVPSAWLRVQPLEEFFIFNPAIVRFHDRLLMTYRVDFGRGASATTRAACAICVLDAQLQVMPGSVVALSDTIVDGGANHFDPRFVVVGDRLFVHYNNNWDTQPNQIFLVELDPQTLAARAPARALHLDGPRQPIEKNWMLFAHEGDLFAIYQIDPHIVLRVEIEARGAVRCRPVHRTMWETGSYTRRYGAPRGGSPPVRVGEHYIALFHSRTLPRAVAAANAPPAVIRMSRTGWFKPIKRWLSERLDPLRYFGGVYGFAAAPPFAPIFIRPEPLLHPEAEACRRQAPAAHLSPRRVVYPSGLVHLAPDRWLVSYGVHDERCVLRSFTERELWGGTVAGRWRAVQP